MNKSNDSLWKIEKVLKKRIRGGHRELLIKWLGWPTKFNSWIVEDQIQQL